jgi:hypothetical protein
MQKLQVIITLETNFIHIYTQNYIFFSSNILCISLYIVALEMKNLNKSNASSSIESINQTLKIKCSANNLKTMGMTCTPYSKSRQFFCSIIQGLKYFGNTVRHLPSTILYAVVCITCQTNNDLRNTRVLSEKKREVSGSKTK